MTGIFQNRVALVTGGSRGIGRATALRLARDGADVGISFASRADDAAAVVAEIRSLGRRACSAACDVSQPAQVAALAEHVRKELGAIDLLAHCGAISNICEHTELTFERWRETIEINLNGAFLAVSAVKDEMLAREYGRIVMVSSIAALRPRRTQIHYAAAKAGVIAMTRCFAEALAPHVRVNCVAPGLVETEMMHVLPQARIDAVRAETPLAKIGQPEEIASVIRFLLSDESSYMTGQTIVACGGRVMIP